MKYEDAIKRATELVAGMTRGLPVNFTDRFAAVKEIADRLMTEGEPTIDKPALPYPYGAMDGFLDSLPDLIERSGVYIENGGSVRLAELIRQELPKVVRVFPTLTELADWIDEIGNGLTREDAIRMANHLLGKLAE